MRLTNQRQKSILLDSTRHIHNIRIVTTQKPDGNGQLTNGFIIWKRDKIGPYKPVSPSIRTYQLLLTAQCRVYIFISDYLLV